MAQTLKFGNGNFATKAGSTLCYDDQNGNFKPIPMDFTRASTATRVNKQGLIEAVTNDRPRIDYTDTSDGVLLLEPASTNSIPYSEDFSQTSFWNSVSNVSTLKNTLSPDGTLNASKITPNTTNGQHSVKSTGILSSNRYVYTIYVKANGYSFFQIANQSTSDIVNFNLNNATYLASNINDEASINYFGNGWYKCMVYFATSFQGIYNVIITNINASRLESFAGNNIDSIDLWGAQAETNSVASSYIPTQGSATTRVAETASGAGNSEVFNDSEGVLFANIAANANDLTNRTIGILGNSSNLIELAYRNTTNQVRALIKSSNVVVVNLQYSLSDITLYNKIVIKYKSNDCSLWVNGFEVLTDTSASMPSGLSELNFNRFDGAEDFYGKTKEIGYYNTILTDLELETLTSYRTWISMVNELNLNIIYNG